MIDLGLIGLSHKEDGIMNRNELARYIDQTTLKPGMTHEYVAGFCEKAKENHFASVCILPNMIETAAQVLEAPIQRYAPSSVSRWDLTGRM